MACFANTQVALWCGEKIEPCGMGKPVPPHDGVYSNKFAQVSKFLPSVAAGEQVGGDEHTEHF